MTLPLFVLVGGPLDTSSEEMRRQWLYDSFPCKDKVTITGYVTREELLMWYSKAGILIVPRSYDTFPLVILDGMQHGLAVIASSIGGALDIIKHGETGLLFTPKDVGALVNCIVMLLKNSQPSISDNC